MFIVFIRPFEYEEYEVSEAEERRYIKIVLDKPAMSDRVIPVYTSDGSATGEVFVMYACM